MFCFHVNLLQILPLMVKRILQSSATIFTGWSGYVKHIFDWPTYSSLKFLQKKVYTKSFCKAFLPKQSTTNYTPDRHRARQIWYRAPESGTQILIIFRALQRYIFLSWISFISADIIYQTFCRNLISWIVKF